MWTFAFFEQLAQDLRYALRTMAANPLFTATAAVARPRHRRQYRHLQLHGRDPAARPAGAPSGATGGRWNGTRARRSAVVKGINGTDARLWQRRFAESQLSLSPPTQLLRAGPAILLHPVRLHLRAELQRDRRRRGGIASPADSFPATTSAAWAFRPPPGACSTTTDDRTGAPPRVVLSYAIGSGASTAIRRGGKIDPDQQSALHRPGRRRARVSSASIRKPTPPFSCPFTPCRRSPPIPPSEERSRFFDDHFYWIEMMGRLRPGVSIEQAQAACARAIPRFAAGTAATPKDAEVLPELSLRSRRLGSRFAAPPVLQAARTC